jgi:predicted dehydrogenase
MIKRYVQVGTGGRARFFYEALTRDYKKTSELLAFCDINQTRMDYANSLIKKYGVGPVNTYKNDEFEKMIEKEKPDAVIVTSIDRTHHDYIIRAM